MRSPPTTPASTVPFDSPTPSSGVLPKGHLAAAHFVLGPAHNPHQFISYRPATGALTYDSNGSLPGHAIELAILPPHLHLTHADFLVF